MCRKYLLRYCERKEIEYGFRLPSGGTCRIAGMYKDEYLKDYLNVLFA